ncbi:MAG TPA: Hsp20/alpha crystallin family protein [Fimbriimonadaceae bacterium]|nr:Hsp20/alpha crystallin family protein [Fimbriimonadaceae bacterium]HRJ33218.1 Hsp20/alpha crystallin family protein [Fimbriimonadaceae bacterium]
MARKELEEWIYISGADLRAGAEELRGRPVKRARGRGWTPHVDVLETEKRIWIIVELAGVAIDQIGIFYSQDRHSVTIRGIREQEALLQGERAVYHQLEIEYGEFAREIALPDSPIDPSQVRATYRQGLLTVMIAKTEPERAIYVRRTLTVRSSGPKST